jgi:hypothetical protein
MILRPPVALITWRFDTEIIESDNGHTTRTITKEVVRPYSYFKKIKNKKTNGLTPVDPAGPDCYQSGTKPCEST